VVVVLNATTVVGDAVDSLEAGVDCGSMVVLLAVVDCGTADDTAVDAGTTVDEGAGGIVVIHVVGAWLVVEVVLVKTVDVVVDGGGVAAVVVGCAVVYITDTRQINGKVESYGTTDQVPEVSIATYPLEPGLGLKPTGW
jgi:hypothetical protein